MFKFHLVVLHELLLLYTKWLKNSNNFKWHERILKTDQINFYPNLYSSLFKLQQWKYLNVQN